ncbi:uncharacterized protein LOC9657350 [Selaginella moellendorffii]|uniref:uncharacterized protein LOC9657350 n=1 Tax=Selaginella moellendorffii TaxID=88036 RepID=UPI000D1CA716|nr:uncharacterized protein LOC9657350 [Selaginella moellendorffii]|eukprot:XP_024541698.1 uncharacterized protein LOC9657350 [Selaginella moellendorffii]
MEGEGEGGFEEALLGLEMAHGMEWRPRSVLDPPPSLIFEEEAEQEAGQEAGQGILQRGVRDADLGPEDEFCLSPLYLITGNAHLDVSEREKSKILGVGSLDSPRHLMVAGQAIMERNAMATFRMDARGEEDKLVPGVFFPLSSSYGASARHMLKDEKGNVMTRWRAALVTTFRPEMLSKAATPRALLEFKELPVVADVKTVDPVLDVIHAGNGEAYLENANAGIWEISKHDNFGDCKRATTSPSFATFWLPCSLEAEAEDAKNAACGMVSYPCSSDIRKVLESGEEQEKWALLKTYSFLVEDEYRSELAKRNSDQDLLQFKMELSKRLALNIESALKESFCGFVDGDSILSVGRVVDYNSTMVATSLSSLSGSSGAPIFLLQPGLDLVFFAVHNGAPLRAANYNLATSTDNPTFVLQYLSVVLGTLPLPSHSYWNGQRRRLRAFERWLARHLGVLRGVANSHEQRAWLSHVEDFVAARRRRLDLG